MNWCLGVVRLVGDMEKRAGIGPLLELLDREHEPRVRTETLAALEPICLTDNWPNHLSTEKLSDEQRSLLTRLLVQMDQQAIPDSLRQSVMEWLEVLAEERYRETTTLALGGDVAGAETICWQPSSWCRERQHQPQAGSPLLRQWRRRTGSDRARRRRPGPS